MSRSECFGQFEEDSDAKIELEESWRYGGVSPGQQHWRMIYIWRWRGPAQSLIGPLGLGLKSLNLKEFLQRVICAVSVSFSLTQVMEDLLSFFGNRWWNKKMWKPCGVALCWLGILLEFTYDVKKRNQHKMNYYMCDTFDNNHTRVSPYLKFRTAKGCHGALTETLKPQSVEWIYLWGDVDFTPPTTSWSHSFL